MESSIPPQSFSRRYCTNHERLAKPANPKTATPFCSARGNHQRAIARFSVPPRAYFPLSELTLRAVADLEIASADQPGFMLDDGRAAIFRHARIQRGLEDHDRAWREVVSEQARCASLQPGPTFFEAFLELRFRDCGIQFIRELFK